MTIPENIQEILDATPLYFESNPSTVELNLVGSWEINNYYEGSAVISVNEKAGVVVLNAEDLNLAQVASTGSYDHLENKPTIPPDPSAQLLLLAQTLSELSAGKQDALGFTPEDSALRGVVYPELDEDRFIKYENVPSWLIKVLEFAGMPSFPEIGEHEKIYIDTTTNEMYRWTGSGWVKLGIDLSDQLNALGTIVDNLASQIAIDISALEISIAGKQASLGYTPENPANRGQPGGYMPLGEDGKAIAALLPDSVDEILEYSNLSAFPSIGQSGKIYLALDTGRTYRWSGSTYVEISASPGSTDAVVEGTTNLYFTPARVINNAPLTDLNLTVGTIVTAADNLLTAIGKLQKQISDASTSLSSHVGNTTGNPHNVTKATIGLGNVQNIDVTNPDNLSANLARRDQDNDFQNKVVSKVRFNAILDTTTARTLSSSDSGGGIEFTSSSAITVTIPTGLLDGFNVSIVQAGTAQVTVVPAAGVTLKNLSGHNKTKGQGAQISISVYKTLNVAYLGGETA